MDITADNVMCEPASYKKNVLICAHTGEKCDPRPCGNCQRLKNTPLLIMKDEINRMLDFCEGCKKYYQCEKVAELNDKLKELEERN